MGRGRGKTYVQSVVLSQELLRTAIISYLCLLDLHFFSFWQVIFIQSYVQLRQNAIQAYNLTERNDSPRVPQGFFGWVRIFSFRQKFYLEPCIIGNISILNQWRQIEEFLRVQVSVRTQQLTRTKLKIIIQVSSFVWMKKFFLPMHHSRNIRCKAGIQPEWETDLLRDTMYPHFHTGGQITVSTPPTAMLLGYWGIPEKQKEINMGKDRSCEYERLCPQLKIEPSTKGQW